MKTIITTRFGRHILLMQAKLRNLSSKITKLRGEYFENRGFSPKNVKRRFCNWTNVAISLLLHENYYYYMFWEAYLAHMWEKLRNLSSKITKLRGEYFKNRGFSPRNVKGWSCNCKNVAISLFLHETFYYYVFWEAYLVHMWEKLRNLSSKITKLRGEYFKNRGFSTKKC